MKYDVFISYAKEDEETAERYARQFSEKGFTVFYAPLNLRRTEFNLHDKILDAIHQSRWVLLLWSPFVDKSEWVAYETATYASMRVKESALERGLVVLDLGGSPLPAWLPVDEYVAHNEHRYLEQLLRIRDRNNLLAVLQTRRALKPRARLFQVLNIPWEVLFGLPAWERRSRSAMPKLRPNFSLAHVRSEDFEKWPVSALIINSFVSLLSICLVLTFATWLVATFIVPYPDSRIIYVQKHVLLVGTASIGIGAILILRTGLAAGIAAGVVGAVFGLAVAMVAGWYTHRGAIPGGVTAGIALGTAAAVSYALGCPIKPEPNRNTPINWQTIILGLAFTFAMFLAAQIFSRIIGEEAPDPSRGTRAAIGLAFGALIGLPVATLTAWVAHLQMRRRYWVKAAWLGMRLWFSLCFLASIAAAIVPFGKPQTLLDGLGIGLIVAVAAGSLTLLLHHFLGLVVSDRWGLMAALTLLLLSAFPLLLLFPNIQIKDAYVALSLSAVVGFLLVRGLQMHSVVNVAERSPPNED